MINPFMESSSHLGAGTLKLSPTNHMNDTGSYLHGHSNQYSVSSNGYGVPHSHHVNGYATRDLLLRRADHITIPGHETNGNSGMFGTPSASFHSHPSESSHMLLPGLQESSPFSSGHHVSNRFGFPSDVYSRMEQYNHMVPQRADHYTQPQSFNVSPVGGLNSMNIGSHGPGAFLRYMRQPDLVHKHSPNASPTLPIHPTATLPTSHQLNEWVICQNNGLQTSEHMPLTPFGNHLNSMHHQTLMQFS
uniref:Uncharacterized protein n=1 Tax=Magallana gigas TaxID=29159 RepID=A0A8W8IMQ3_MAGGI